MAHAADQGPPAAQFSISTTPRSSITLRAHNTEPIQLSGSTRIEQAITGREQDAASCVSPERRSSAAALVGVDVLDQSRDHVALSLVAQSVSTGGHYRTCFACVEATPGEKTCVGVTGHDTRGSARASASSVTTVQFLSNATNAPYLLEVGSSAQGSSASIRVSDKNGATLPLWHGNAGTYEVRAAPGAVYYVTAEVSANTENSGSCCDDQQRGTAKIDVAVRKAPLLDALASFEPFIKGGEETHAYPNVGAILINGRLHCTGTAISKRTILTAAHCVQGYENQFDKFTFLLGSNLVQPSFGPVQLDGYDYPRSDPLGFSFNPATLEDDIAVLYSAATMAVQPVTLHTGSPPWQSLVDRSLIFVGFGFDVIDNQQVGSGIKREAAWSINWVENRRVRFSVPGKNTCKGDSGGPAFLIWQGKLIQVAITSGGTPDCTSGFETRTDAFQNWLASRIRQ